MSGRRRPVPWDISKDRSQAKSVFAETWARAGTDRVEVARGGGRGRTGTALACLAILDVCLPTRPCRTCVSTITPSGRDAMAEALRSSVYVRVNPLGRCLTAPTPCGIGYQASENLRCQLTA